MNCFARTKSRDTPPGNVQQRISSLAIPPAHAPSFTRSQPLPRRVHVCVSVCRMGTGAVPPEGWGPVDVTGSAAQSAAVSRPRRWYWGSEGAVLYNAVFGSQRGRKKPSWRKAPSPPPGPGHRVPGAGSFPPPAVAGRFVSPRLCSPGYSRGAPAGAAQGTRPQEGRPTAPGTRRDPGVRPPRGPRDEIQEGTRALPPKGAGRGRP